MGFECTICSEFLDSEASTFWQSNNATKAGTSATPGAAGPSRGRKAKSKNESRNGQQAAAPPAENKAVIVTKCGHIFHKVCLADWLKKSCICPFCHSEVANNEIRTVYPNRESNKEQDDLRLQCKDAKIQVEQLQKQNFDLTERKKKMATLIESLNNNLLENVDNVASLTKEISKVTTNLKQAESNLKVQQENAEVAKSQLKSKEIVIQELRMQDRNNQTRIKEQGEQLKAKEVGKIEMCNQFIERGFKIDELLESMKLADEKISMLTDKLANLEIQLTKAKDDSGKDFRRLVSTMKELNDTNDKLQKANANHEKCEPKILHLSTALKDSNEKIEHLQEEFQSKINLVSNVQEDTQLQLAKTRLAFFEKSMAQFTAFRLEQENAQKILNNYCEQLKKDPINFNQSNAQEAFTEELGEQPQTWFKKNDGKETFPTKKTEKSTLSPSKENELTDGSSSSSFDENSSGGSGSPKKRKMTKST